MAKYLGYNKTGEEVIKDFNSNIKTGNIKNYFLTILLLYI